MSSTSFSKTSNTLVSLGTAALFVVGPILYYRYVAAFAKKTNANQNNNGVYGTTLSSIVRRGSKLRPPFPTIVKEMLSKCRLAYLSTVDMDVASSHLSLMRFTYLNDQEDGEIVVLSTNKKTKKFDMLQKQNGVALLVHDFGQQTNEAGMYSITLNGNCRIVTDPVKAEQYRKAHLAHNPDYPQFIVGDDIAILAVDVTTARICDINDQVTKWDITESGK